jgi:hypothetical protein
MMQLIGCSATFELGSAPYSGAEKRLAGDVLELRHAWALRMIFIWACDAEME